VSSGEAKASVGTNHPRSPLNKLLRFDLKHRANCRASRSDRIELTRMNDNLLYYGDNLDVLRRHVKDESVDLVYLDPPFNSNAS
jgi:16S rRNA G966 N2-methylase RsmD